MKNGVHFAGMLVAVLSLMFAGCGGGGDSSSLDQALDLSGTWDINPGDGILVVTLVQSGNDLSGPVTQEITVHGTVTDGHVVFALYMGPTTMTFDGTLSSDGNTLTGTWTSSNSHVGTFTAPRRGTGEGADMTGRWLSADISLGTSASMDIVQNGHTLTGTVQGSSGSTLPGTIVGSQVSFSTQVAGNTISWTGYLSADGNTVSGYWLNSGAATMGGWLMTRQ